MKSIVKPLETVNDEFTAKTTIEALSKFIREKKAENVLNAQLLWLNARVVETGDGLKCVIDPMVMEDGDIHRKQAIWACNLATKADADVVANGTFVDAVVKYSNVKYINAETGEESHNLPKLVALIDADGKPFLFHGGRPESTTDFAGWREAAE